MSGFKEPGFADRQKAAQQAKKNLLNKFRAQPGPDDPAVAKRRAEREAVAAKREQARLEREAAKAEQKRREEEAAAAEALRASHARRKKRPHDWPRSKPSRRPSATRAMPRARTAARRSSQSDQARSR